ncbi:Dephospho-CoA kinase [Harpegnathos saltator]|uniref:Dephospho-CoA kinase n=1 Tax=Harpegnathos saltator TaxID=610380 RepID=E2B9L6_HARSA|nr:Dephospho-CoA kinase [Harpegnathos saltator]
MGKSTTANFFAEAGIPVYSADTAVHELYRQADVIAQIGSLFPQAIENGSVNRQKLAAAILDRPEAIKQLEAIVHPLVRMAEKNFVDKARKAGHRLVVLDVPLLYETGGDQRVDKVVVVSAPVEIQRERVLKRADMTGEKFATLLARQMKDEEKRSRADFVIDTGKGLDVAREAVNSILQTLLEQKDG